jgi:lipoprotein-anchoring transpeptidase ErfK/SrfK
VSLFGCSAYSSSGQTGKPDKRDKSSSSLPSNEESKAQTDKPAILYHERVAAVPPPPVVIGSINASTMRSGTRVIINLSEQRAYLIEGGKVSLISPIASGKPGWSTPTGNFSVISKDIDHRSGSFGSVIDGSGRIATANATPGTYVPPGFHYRPAPMPYYMEFSQAIGMHAGYLPGYPASHGCVRMPRDLAARFFERVNIRTPVTVAGSTGT